MKRKGQQTCRRTVAALLNEKGRPEGFVKRFQQWKENRTDSLLRKMREGGPADSRKIQVYCRSINIAERFLKDAEAEGFTFSDGVSPSQKETSDLFALHKDWTINYEGWAGHILFKNPDSLLRGRLVRIDYGKYISGAEDYVI